MEVMQPGTQHEFDVLLSRCYNNGNPSYIRMAADEHGLDLPVEFGKGVVVKQTAQAKLTVATAGPLLRNVVAACSDLPVNIAYFHTIKPLDVELLDQFAGTRFLVVHDAFGLFEAISVARPVKATCYGLPDQFCCYYGTLESIREKLGLDAVGIRSRVGSILAEST
jgi:transketolase